MTRKTNYMSITKIKELNTHYKNIIGDYYGNLYRECQLGFDESIEEYLKLNLTIDEVVEQMVYSSYDKKITIKLYSEMDLNFNCVKKGIVVPLLEERAKALKEIDKKRDIKLDLLKNWYFAVLKSKDFFDFNLFPLDDTTEVAY